MDKQLFLASGQVLGSVACVWLLRLGSRTLPIRAAEPPAGLQGPEGERITILWALVFDVIFLPMCTVVHIVRNRGMSAAAKIVWVAVVVCLRDRDASVLVGRRC